MEMYSFNLLLSGELLISPYILNESLAGLCSLSCRSLLFITWNISCHSFLACSVSVEKSVAIQIGVFLFVTSRFSSAAFKVLSLSFKLGILIMVCLRL